MDASKFQEIKIAPRAVFDALEQRASRPRFMVSSPEGGWRAVTWADFAEQIRDVALMLRVRGLQNGDRAAIFAHNSVEWAVAALAIQAAGGTMVPIYPASTRAQALYVLEHSDARFVFTDKASRIAPITRASGADPSMGFKGEVVTFEAAAWKDARAVGAKRHAEDPQAFDRSMNSVSLAQPGLMLYTSGTSGNPKGVPLTHANVAINGRDWLNALAKLIDENSVDLLWLPMSHIFGLGEMCLGNTLGFTTYLADPAAVFAKLPEVKPNVFMSVPSHWEKICVLSEGKKEKLAQITGGRFKFCLSGGAGLKREVKETLHANGILIIEGYGLTEASPTLTMNTPEAFRFDTVGKPFPSVQLKLADDGEILAKGPNVFGGYHKDPVATREAFTDDGWFKTGDVGMWTEDGFLKIVDRKKDILVTAGGKNVPPANIEIRFRDDPILSHLVVYGDGKKFLVAGVWPNPDTTRGLSPEELRAKVQASVDRVNQELASFETIKKFAIMDRPLTVEGEMLTASFKVRRKKVYEAYKTQFESLYGA
jgi:long-chain acyl-CoA synthetase